MKLSNSSGQVNRRRKNALLRLQQQLVNGVSHKTGEIVALTEYEVAHINKEIANLQTKIVSDAAARSTKPKIFRGAR